MISSSLKQRGCYAVRRICLALAILAVSGVAHAEPYLTVRSGQKCIACRIDPEGVGMRTLFGRIYGQTVLPGTPSTKPLMQQASEYLDIGEANREAWFMLKNSKQDNFLLAGSFYLPYGLSMEVEKHTDTDMRRNR